MVDRRSTEIELAGQLLEVRLGMGTARVGHRPRPRRKVVQPTGRIQAVDGPDLALGRAHRPVHVGGLRVEEPVQSVLDVVADVLGDDPMLSYPHW